MFSPEREYSRPRAYASSEYDLEHASQGRKLFPAPHTEAGSLMRHSEAPASAAERQRPGTSTDAHKN